MYTNNKLSKAVRLAIIFGAASATALTASVAVAAEEDEEAKKVERIEVTGSRIKRTDLEGAMPITVIDRAQIELSGEISVAELLRGTTFNSAGSFRPQSGSSAQGVSQLDMRGLGASRTLILIDGRRLPKSPSTGSSQDLNTIPIGAVERIEMLTDGASAVYGSDAIGGVVNIITRRDYNGAELTIGAGKVNTPSEGGDRDFGSVLFGSASSKTSLLGGVSWNKRGIIFERDFPWTQPGSSAYGNNWTPWSLYGPMEAIPGGCSEPNFVPGTRDVTAAADPRVGGTTAICQYNFNATNANEASSDNESIFVKAEHQINDDWRVFTSASVAKTESFGRYAPAPDWVEIAPDSYNNPTNPNAWFYDANNPNSVAYDPAVHGRFGNQWVDGYHRYAALGNRDGYVTNNNSDLLVGFSGTIGDVDVEVGVRRNRNKTYDIGYNYVVRAIAGDFISNFNPGYCSNGTFDESCRYGYDLQFPSSNPDDVLNGMKATISRISRFDQDEVYGNASFDVFELGAGMIQAFVGFEYRKEDYVDQYDSLSEGGQIGGSAGNSAGGARDARSLFAEVLVPVTDTFELNFAGRYDDYSDYGSDFSPKASFRWEALSGLVFRGSYGHGFRAPSLDILTQKDSFSAVTVNHQPTCDVRGSQSATQCQIQVDTFYVANPDLSSEQSEQASLGVAYQPTDWLNFAVDYWDIKIEDRIAQIGPSTLLQYLAQGLPLPAGLSVDLGPAGDVRQIIAGFANQGTVNTSGIDLNVVTNFNFGEFGSLRTNLTTSYTNEYKMDGGRNLIGDPGQPKYRVNLENVYNVSDFSVGWVMNVIGDQARCYPNNQEIVNAAGLRVCAGGAANQGKPRNGHYGTYVTHDFQVSYHTPWNGRITVGLQNAFEKLPERVDITLSGRDYNYDLYDAYGRVTYARYTQTF